MKFKLIKDLIFNNGFEDELILKKDDIIEPNEDGEYLFTKLNRKYPKEDLLAKPNIFKPINDIKLEVSEIDENDEDKIGNWRIQLDVKTSKRKLKEIEKILKDVVNDLL